MEIRTLISALQARFENAGVENARGAAEELVSRRLGCRPLEIYLRAEPLPTEIVQALEEDARRVAAGEPVAYVTGRKNFFGRDFICDRRALIPRPETELLVEWVLKALRRRKGEALRVADVGTGTGCIVLTLALEQPGHRWFGVDRSAAALELAQENARHLGAEGFVTWREGDLLKGWGEGSLDLVVSNPPYIPSAEVGRLAGSVRNHEPQAALDGGPDGLTLIRRLVAQARRVLAPGGEIYLEIGFDQGERVPALLREEGFAEVTLRRDLAGFPRLVRGRAVTR